MAEATTASEPLERRTADRLHHLYEDDPNWSLCGRDITHEAERDPLPGEPLCVVCAALDDALPETGEPSR
jgi:hypothetical protein